MLLEVMKGTRDLLNDAIDRIAGPGAGPQSAEAVAASMTPAEIREAAIIHLSTLLEAEPESVDDQGILVGGLRVKLEPSENVNAAIRYDDVAAGFTVEGASLARHDGPKSLAALLRIYLYARDRSDNLLYLPAAMRAERIAALVDSTKASERFICYLLARYQILSARAAA
ncbi:hypothetical protein [Sphingobium sp. CFD-1]|uniref:hypothetical protein n=1 Tax=Sphingobium sp. CFD-1 TaxID=2878545 RepID=UPI00214B48B1|nr:hypothetical protein [Sphingobium sp. CFD-1]